MTTDNDDESRGLRAFFLCCLLAGAVMTVGLAMCSKPAKAFEIDRHGAHGWTDGYPSNDHFGTYRKREPKTPRKRAERKAPAASCLPPSIKDALATADAACRIQVISTFRPGARIAGTNHPSMHASCRAADFTTPQPACVLRVLASWRGKLSIDYARMRHFHIDDGSYARFVHGGVRKRYARRHGGRRI